MGYHLKPTPSFPIRIRFSILLIFIFVDIPIICCGSETSNMQLIVLRPNGRGFMERDSGHPYIPFGTNYYDPHTGWAPKIWQQFDAEKVRWHFQVMSGWGLFSSSFHFTFSLIYICYFTTNSTIKAKPVKRFLKKPDRLYLL